ncbi:uncharacterized protein METZ01_LOCUS419709, partial [marine metagenome]
MKTFKSFTEFGQAYKEEKNWKDEEMPSASKDITKYTVNDLNKNKQRKSSDFIVLAKFLYMDDSKSGVQAGNIKGTDNRIHDDEQKPTALYMTIIGPDRTGKFLYPKGAYYVSHERVNAVGETISGWTGPARLVTHDVKDATAYIKRFGDIGLQKKQIEKGSKGWDAWP